MPRGTQPAADASAAHEQRKIVQKLHLRRLRLDGRKKRVVGIVGKQHDMRQLKGGMLADLHPGRNAGEHRALRCAYERARLLLIVIAFKIQFADQAATHPPVRLRALHKYKGICKRFKKLCFVAAHCAVDFCNTLRCIPGTEIDLGQNQMQR